MMQRRLSALLTLTISAGFLSACSLTPGTDGSSVTLITSERQLPGPCEHLGFIEVSESAWSIESAQADASEALKTKAAERKANYVSLNQRQQSQGTLLFTQNLGGNIYRCK